MKRTLSLHGGTNFAHPCPLSAFTTACSTSVRYAAGVDSFGRLLIANANALTAVWSSPMPEVILRAGATFWSFVAPDGGIYVVYGTRWNEADSRIVLSCNARNPLGACVAVSPNMPPTEYDALHSMVFRNIKTTGERGN